MRKLVFIDDDPIDHFMMKHILRDKNYFDTTTYTIYGSLVLDYIEENKSEAEKLPDIIFLELHMPGVNGWEFLDRFQKIQSGLIKDIPVYVISSSLPSCDRDIISKYSFVSEFVSKPVDAMEIERIVGPKFAA